MNLDYYKLKASLRLSLKTSSTNQEFSSAMALTSALCTRPLVRIECLHLARSHAGKWSGLI